MPDEKNRVMDDSFPDDTGLERLCGLIAELPDFDPPFDLKDAVMNRLTPHRPSTWGRFVKWMSSPKTITFTPVRLASVLAGLAFLLCLIPLFGENDTQQNRYVKSNNAFPVVFSFYNEGARSVQVVGSFNYWNPEGYALTESKKKGYWELRTKLPAGCHEYSFLVDGKNLLPDPNAAFTKDDGFGNINSLLYLGNETAI